MTDRPPLPIDVQGPVAATTMLWHHAGRSTLTVIGKVTLALRQGEAPLISPSPVLVLDTPDRESDLVPHKPRADIVFIGAAHPPAPSMEVMTRLTVRGRWGEITKRVHCVAGQPFSELPLLWERTWGSSENPVGVRPGGAALLRDPEQPGAPACYAPIPRAWPGRARFVVGGQSDALTGLEQHMPTQISWGYFLHAPPDQQVPRLFGDEELELENLVAGAPKLHTRLRVEPPELRFFGPSAPDGGAKLEMKCDSMLIDGQKQRIELVFRSTMPCPDRAIMAQCGLAMVAHGVVAATAGLPRAEAPPVESVTMPLGRQLVADPPTLDVDEDEVESVGGSTMAIDPEAAMLLLQGARATPWERAPPAATPAGASPPGDVPAPAVRGGPHPEPPGAQDEDDDSVGPTMALTPEAAAALMARGPAPRPEPTPGVGRVPVRQGTMEMEAEADRDSSPPKTMILSDPHKLPRGR